ncbi:hypothetical protein E1B28_002465 [Marasmius oreades]|uniref:Uncharacterized protein n=1 Tax=Marasmius oreades TaxID=181124 RepID=A0A9P7RNE3_9AGAR|nr:uncharacterized protein E1B28_002465 [Marasmius oreades]KAG7086512.1 hypothetical protein E1B28_002465 [Marasmius oreades]
MGFRDRRALYHPYNSRPGQRRGPSLTAESMRPTRKPLPAIPTPQDKLSKPDVRKEVNIAIRGVAEDAHSQLTTSGPNACLDVDDGLNSRASLTLKASGGLLQSTFVTDVIKDMLRHAAGCEIQIVPSVVKSNEGSAIDKPCLKVKLEELSDTTVLNTATELTHSTDTQDDGRMELTRSRHRRLNPDVTRRGTLGMKKKTKNNRPKELTYPEESRIIPSSLSSISPAADITSVFESSRLLSGPKNDVKMSRDERQAQIVREPRIIPLLSLSPVDDSFMADVPSSHSSCTKNTAKVPHASTQIIWESGTSFRSRISSATNDSSMVDTPLFLPPSSEENTTRVSHGVKEPRMTRRLLSRIPPTANESSVVDPLPESRFSSNVEELYREREAYLRSILLARRSSAHSTPAKTPCLGF